MGTRELSLKLNLERESVNRAAVFLRKWLAAAQLSFDDLGSGFLDGCCESSYRRLSAADKAAGEITLSVSLDKLRVRLASLAKKRNILLKSHECSV